MATIMHAEPHDQRQHDEEKPDPFARSATDHPAISQSVGVSPDIYRNLFDVFFESEIFQRWLHRQNTWQLHCIGGPGCGKSTFAALALERIREHYHDSIHNTIQVASLFVADIALENELIFVEDCLRHVYYQLSPIGKVAKLVSTKCYDRYATARDKGRRIAVRIECIAHALRQRLLEIGEKGVAFLVVDNLDRCSPTLIEILERELSTLQKLGLGIMTTSRLPKHDKLEDVWCDYHERGPHDPALHFYWRCSCCERRYMCERETCYRVDRVCDECAEDTSWAQPEHMNIFLEGMWEGYLRDFMAWDMEREHGDLGLGSSADKPPLSAFGYAFRRAGLGYDWIAQNLWYVNNSVVQTKLALDRIHAASSPEEVEPLPNRMPANMQALYTNALKAIESQPAGQRELAMRSIAAVGKRAKTDAGLPVTILADLVRGRPSTVDVSRVPPRSVEDILTSTKGYLRLQAPTAEQSHYNVAAFDRLFFDFLNQDYSDIVVMANALLRTSNIPRSLTRGHFEPSKSHFEVPQLSRQDMFKELREFRSPKLVSSPGESPGPLRRTSSGVKRSQTLISFEMPQESPPVLGLGLDPASFGSQL